MKITYNAPVVLSLSILSIVVMGITSTFDGNFASDHFASRGNIRWNNLSQLAGLISHIAGHANWGHLTGNVMFILLLGPLLEERYGSGKMLLLILITAFTTGIANALFFDSGIMGASGIVFMMILLSSLVNFKSGEVPLTFVVIAILFFSKEIFSAITEDNISQFAHIMGGVCGSLFGFSSKGRSAS